MTIKEAVEHFAKLQENSANHKNSFDIADKTENARKIVVDNNIVIINNEVYVIERRNTKLIAKFQWTSEVNKKTLCNHKWKAKVIWEVN